LEQNPEKINWSSLAQNPAAIHLLEQNPEKIVWHWLSMNPAAIHLLEQNPEKIKWSSLSMNSSIFVYDYHEMKEFKKTYHEEMIKTMFHPKNMNKFDSWGFDTGLQEE
jgi:hypothetical protein